MKTIGLQFEGVIATPIRDKKGVVEIATWKPRNGAAEALLRMSADPKFCPIITTSFDFNHVKDYLFKKFRIIAVPYVTGMMKNNNEVYLTSKPYPFDLYVFSSGEAQRFSRWSAIAEFFMP